MNDSIEPGNAWSDLSVAFLTCGIMSFFTWFVMRPIIGWDDANITMNYAQNIANGLGYVYFEGGERVEGSTSPLWTALNILGFLLTDRPEPLFAIISFALTSATIMFTILIGRSLFRMAGMNGVRVPFIVAFFFILVPAYFSVAVWSLMETGLVCLSVASFLWASTRIIEEWQRPNPSLLRLGLAHGFFGLLIVLSRPEGVILVVGASLVLLLLGLRQSAVSFFLIPLPTLGTAVLAFVVSTAARLAYFGVPYPNTYYAKVSTDRLEEVKAGLLYVMSYLSTPEHFLLLSLSVLALAIFLWRPRDCPVLISTAVFFSALIAGGLVVYTLLGGDHFPGHRYFQIFLPMLIPAASLAVARFASDAGAAKKTAIAGTMAAVVVLQTWQFSVGHREFTFGFRLAESAREVGMRLNELPGKPSVAVYIAGGIAMTYEGPIYDMNGLNWVAMAHADRERRDAWGGFSKSLFYETLPKIVSPLLSDCQNADWSYNPWANRMLHGLYEDEKFKNLYEMECWNHLAFFRLKERYG